MYFKLLRKLLSIKKIKTKKSDCSSFFWKKKYKE